MTPGEGSTQLKRYSRMTRRHILRAAGAGVVAGLAGCSSVFTSRPDMDLAVANYRDKPVDIELVVFPAGVDDESRAVYQKRVTLPTMSGEQDMWRAEAIAPSREYSVEISFVDVDRSARYRYEPTCSQGDVDDIGVRIDIYDDDVRFHQSDCS